MERLFWRKTLSREKTLVLVFLVGTGILTSAGTAVSAGDSVTLRVNDMAAEPGGIAAVVLRTYAPRGLEQGEICVSVSGGAKSQAIAPKPGSRALGRQLRTKSAPSPFVALEAVEVYSDAGDVTVAAAFDEAAQIALVQFASATATVNESDGPMVVLYFRVSATLAVDSIFDVGIDLDDTFLLDAEGESVTIEPKSGRLEIQVPGNPMRLEALEDRVAPGALARLGVRTRKSSPVASGQVVFTYDPAFADGAAEVTMDPRYGKAFYTVDTSATGRVVVSFLSPDGSLNNVPGEIISLRLPISPNLSDGMRGPVALDSSSTYLFDPQGGLIALELLDAELEIDG